MQEQTTTTQWRRASPKTLVPFEKDDRKVSEWSGIQVGKKGGERRDGDELGR